MTEYHNFDAWGENGMWGPWNIRAQTVVEDKMGDEILHSYVGIIS